ncbi:unnamed protein product, partial [Penicillium nalgiovense]
VSLSPPFCWIRAPQRRDCFPARAGVDSRGSGGVFFFFFFLFAFFAFFALLLSLCVFLEVPMTIHVIMSRENCVLRLFSSRYPTVISAWFESSSPKTIATCLFHVNPDI